MEQYLKYFRLKTIENVNMSVLIPKCFFFFFVEMIFLVWRDIHNQFFAKLFILQ